MTLDAPTDRPSPVTLWRSVLDARARLADARHQAQGTSAQAAREDLLRALEAYVKSLEARRHPVPYAIRDELRIQRLTSAPHQRTPGM